MCGIVAYIGGEDAAPILLEGLHRLEYRGYDSAGVAVLATKGLKVRKVKGRVRDLAAALPARFTGGLGHRPHPLGHPRRADRRQRPPALSTRRAHRGRAQRHHRERRRAARQARGRRRRSSPSETDTEVLAT